MGKNDLREHLMYKNYKWTAPKYYDYPDGQDLLGKLSFTTKMGFFAGALGGLFFATRYGPKPKTFRGVLLRTMLYTVPCVAAPFTFTTVTYFSTNIRKKDDQLNYIFGSVAAAVVAAKLARIPEYTLFLSIIFSSIGIAKKTAEMNGTILFPPSVKKYEPPYYQRTMNLSLVPDGEPEWTNKLPVAEE